VYFRCLFISTENVAPSQDVAVRHLAELQLPVCVLQRRLVHDVELDLRPVQLDQHPGDINALYFLFIFAFCHLGNFLKLAITMYSIQ
jgi:hypothetical protein